MRESLNEGGAAKVMPLNPIRDKQLRQLVQKLGLPAQAPVRWDLLDQALTHVTADAVRNYERLEFVGDAVVKLAAAQFLFETYPQQTEGELSAMRGALVSDRTLAQIGDRYNLERYLLLGSNALADPTGRTTRLADGLEALLAALFLSTGDLTLIRPWLDSHLQEFAEIIRQDPTLQNYKGALQGITQGRYQVLPEYRVRELGQKHGDPERFLAEVWVNDRCWGEGRGASKKAAEQAAAQIAFQALQEHAENKHPEGSVQH